MIVPQEQDFSINQHTSHNSTSFTNDLEKHHMALRHQLHFLAAGLLPGLPWGLWGLWGDSMHALSLSPSTFSTSASEPAKL